LARRGDEQLVSLFCYDNAALPDLLNRCAGRPTLLLATAGHAAAQVSRLLGPGLQRGALRAVLLPWLSQTDYDHLLWSCDLNFVRGEDSFVRAMWAGRPFVWQAYPQQDGAHAAKIDAFLDRFLATADSALAAPLRHGWHAWNGLVAPTDRLPLDLPAWAPAALAWRDHLLAQADLSTQLIGAVSESR